MYIHGGDPDDILRILVYMYSGVIQHIETNAIFVAGVSVRVYFIYCKH